MFLPEISEQVLVRLDICSDSIRESADPSREFLPEKDLPTADHLLVHRQQDMVFYTLPMHY